MYRSTVDVENISWVKNQFPIRINQMAPGLNRTGFYDIGLLIAQAHKFLLEAGEVLRDRLCLFLLHGPSNIS